MKRALVCGSGDCFFQDMIKLSKLVKNFDEDFDAIMVNHTALYYPYFFKHWCTLHPEIFTSVRRYIQSKCQFITHSNRYHKNEVDKIWPMTMYGGDSGLFATRVALELGYDKVVLVGIPLDNRSKFYEIPSPKGAYFEADSTQNIWRDETKDSKSKIRSFSGNTLKMFGAPTKEWIYG